MYDLKHFTKKAARNVQLQVDILYSVYQGCASGVRRGLIHVDPRGILIIFKTAMNYTVLM